MSNPAFMSVIFEGQRKELKSLYGKMKRLQERERIATSEEWVLLSTAMVRKFGDKTWS